MLFRFGCSLCCCFCFCCCCAHSRPRLISLSSSCLVLPLARQGPKGRAPMSWFTFAYQQLTSSSSTLDSEFLLFPFSSPSFSKSYPRPRTQRFPSSPTQPVRGFTFATWYHLTRPVSTVWAAVVNHILLQYNSTLSLSKQLCFSSLIAAEKDSIHSTRLSFRITLWPQI